MTSQKFLQFHTLTTYPGALLNRDDAGFAKRLPFGGSTRTRVSSQCLKYHWRNHDGEHALYDLDVPRSIRSRRTFNERVSQPLIEEGYSEPLVRGTVLTLQEMLLSDDTPSKSDVKSLLQPDEGEDPDEMLETNQVTILGEPELRYLRDLVVDRIESIQEEFEQELNGNPEEWSSDLVQDLADEVREIDDRDLKENLKGLALASGLDAAMFGRMATSDVLARGDAAVHVAHSFTTHKESAESDYFTAVDELKSDTEEMGSGHLNTSELTSGLFYSYVVIDVPLLVSNIEGCPREQWQEVDPGLAADVVDRFVRLITTVSPGAKLGSTAPYSYAQLLLAEAGDHQPRSLANAFQKPVSKEGKLRENTYDALGRYLEEIDEMYGQRTERRLAGVGEVNPVLERIERDESDSVPDVANWAADVVRG